MKDLIYLNLPYLGRIYIQRDMVTLHRFELQALDGPNGREWLLCLGSLRVHQTPASVVPAEASPERR